ncbi:hypothetical protein D1227_06270 [Henriciella mobilis]|uniref:hypothetical protein n=1 Tax=Henriciella mobilis TaxID=2305467 RepID=UPI000E6749B3|nr:hypothetical protein [Henriciella mobilis]RIJ15983.1 hypothetical protein D1231_09330 [Henriciella mobilis]RIJ21193.1 hypothetical protein D1227_12870 [Henriciella mobilis]RIJ23106.1 hypothetical protein D1227_06270 [Henriciella mobilis]
MTVFILLYLAIGLIDMTARQISFQGTDDSIVSALMVLAFIIACAAFWPVRLALDVWRRFA